MAAASRGGWPRPLYVAVATSCIVARSADVHSFLEGAGSGTLVSEHLPTCESKNLDTSEPKLSKLLEEAKAPFTTEEIKAAREEAGFYKATCQSKPIALYVLGPSAVGKTTATQKAVDDVGIATLESGDLDAVYLDGDLWRNHHKGYNDLCEYGLTLHCIFKRAWDGVSPHSKKQKKALEESAQHDMCRKHLVIPHTCNTYKVCEEQIKTLKKAGYTVHVHAIIAPRKDVSERGLSRADRSGKYFTMAFEKPMAAFLPMMALANGNCEFVDGTVRPPKTLRVFPCLNQDVYDFMGVPPVVVEAQGEAVRISGVPESEFEAAQKTQGVFPKVLELAKATEPPEARDTRGFLKLSHVVFVLLASVVVYLVCIKPSATTGAAARTVARTATSESRSSTRPVGIELSNK